VTVRPISAVGDRVSFAPLEERPPSPRSVAKRRPRLARRGRRSWGERRHYEPGRGDDASLRPADTSCLQSARARSPNAPRRSATHSAHRAWGWEPSCLPLADRREGPPRRLDARRATPPRGRRRSGSGEPNAASPPVWITGRPSSKPEGISREVSQTRQEPLRAEDRASRLRLPRPPRGARPTRRRLGNGPPGRRGTRQLRPRGRGALP